MCTSVLPECYVCVRVPDSLELELQTVVSCHVGAGNRTNPGPLEEQSVPLTTEFSLQTPVVLTTLE